MRIPLARRLAREVARARAYSQIDGARPRPSVRERDARARSAPPRRQGSDLPPLTGRTRLRRIATVAAADRARARVLLLRARDHADLELPPRDPHGRVAARQRRGRHRREGRVHLLQPHRAEQGRADAEGAAARRLRHGAGAARGCQRIPARARAAPCFTPRCPARASGTPPGPASKARTARARDDASRPARIPARARGGRLDQHAAHDDSRSTRAGSSRP